MLNTSPVPVEFMSCGRTGGSVTSLPSASNRAARAQMDHHSLHTQSVSRFSAVSKSGQPVNSQSSRTLPWARSPCQAIRGEAVCGAQSQSRCRWTSTDRKLRSSDVVMPRRRAFAEQTRVSTSSIEREKPHVRSQEVRAPVQRPQVEVLKAQRLVVGRQLRKCLWPLARPRAIVVPVGACGSRASKSAQPWPCMACSRRCASGSDPTLPTNRMAAPKAAAAQALFAPPPPMVSTIGGTEVSPSSNNPGAAGTLCTSHRG